MADTYRKLVLMIAGAVMLAACETSGAAVGDPVSAVLASTDAQTMAKLKSALAEAMGRANIELGPGDLTKTSTISVLPPRPGPYEGRSTAKPTQFDLMLRGSQCFVVRRDTGEEFALEDVKCRAADD